MKTFTESDALLFLIDYNRKGKKVRKNTHRIVISGNRYVQGIPYFLTAFAERAFVFASRADAEGFCGRFANLLPEARVITSKR